MRVELRQTLRFGTAVAVGLVCTLAAAQNSSPPSLNQILDRTSQRVSEFLEQFSNVECVEEVTQTKLKPDGRVQLEERSVYDYLVILTNTGGEISLDESRLPVKVAKADRQKNVSMLMSNGFATLFLIFHRHYSGGYEFSDGGAENVSGHNVRKIHFEHIRNTSSVAALALRRREYSLELSGNAWIDPDTGDLLRLEAGIGSTLEDLGMKTLQSTVRLAPVTFSKDNPVYWFPVEAIVEVETPKQHWRNTHEFTNYKQFSASAKEQGASK